MESDYRALLPDYDDDDDDGGNYGAIAVAEEERKVWKIWPWQMIPPMGAGQTVKRQMVTYRIMAFGEEMAGFGQVVKGLGNLHHLSLSCVGLRQVVKVWIWTSPPDRLLRRNAANGENIILDLCMCIVLTKVVYGDGTFRTAPSTAVGRFHQNLWVHFKSPICSRVI